MITWFRKVTNRAATKKIAFTPHTIWTNPIHFIACGFGFGTFPVMPGTIGTLLGIPLAFLLAPLALPHYITTCVLMFGAGVIVCHITNRDFKTQDHPAAVIDEIVTFPIALFSIPMTWTSILMAFLLFRFFDIIKPGPIGWVDKNVHGGFGVMLDDFLAALATLSVMHFIRWIL